MGHLTNTLQSNIRRQLSLRNMSVSELERRAGLKQSTIQNILHGRSKNPSVETIQSIAGELHCSIEELISEVAHQSSVPPQIRSGEESDVDDSNGVWNAVLFIKTIEVVQKILDKRQVVLPKKQILAAVDEIYKYSIGISDGISNAIDERFAEWLIEKVLRQAL